LDRVSLVKVLPVWAAIGLTVLGGVGSAAQSLANAEMGERTGHPILGALVNNTGGVALVLLGLVALPSMRTGLRVLRRTRLPWWTYLGGVCGAFFIVAATYIVPVLGVAAYTIAQVAGQSGGGLVVDRTRLAPAGRMGLTGPRLAGAALGVGAVALAQLNRPIGDLAVGLMLLGIACGAVIAIQGALNGRVASVGNPAAATAINFAVSSAAMVGVAAGVGAFGWLAAADWPSEWYLYVGGPLGVGITVVVLLGIRSVGLLRTGLALVAGQLGGALLLDLRPGGPGASAAVLVGALMTLVAVVVSGRATRGTPTAA
jgi:transporter family-2 protein